MIEFKAWDKHTKKMVFHSPDLEAENSYNFKISLDGSISVTQRIHGYGFGLRSICREPEDFELFFSIGLTTKDNKKIFPGDIIQKEGDKPVTVGYGEYEESNNDSWGVKAKHFGPHIIFDDGGTYAITQDGNGYSLAAGECTHLGHTYEQ